jgi:hypothetical protein
MIIFQFCGEPVTSVTGGCVGSEDNELLASTFSGRIFALRSRRHVPGASLGNIPQDALTLRRSKLECVLDDNIHFTTSKIITYVNTIRVRAPYRLDVCMMSRYKHLLETVMFM